MRLSRRHLLAAAPLLLSRRVLATPPPATARLLSPVNVSPDRVIRTIVGLRPFRPSGFVVRGEKLGEKTVIHNYGHGGAGITLSWGTAQLAVEEAAKSSARDCAVIGCGVVGLSTARLLQLRGYNPAIYTKDMPPATTSNVAGGLWEPTTVFDLPQVTPEFRRQFVEASQFSFRRYQSMAGDTYGVRWLPVYSLANSEFPAQSPPSSPYSEVNPLYPETRLLKGPEVPFDVPYGRRRYSMLIEPSIYLNALMRDFYTAGGRIGVRDFAAARDLTALSEALIFNCTGLGARSLFNDEELIPIRGQLVFLLPQPEVDYMTLGPGDIYMFPRRDGILLGGTHDRGSWDTTVDPATTDRILREHAALFASIR